MSVLWTTEQRKVIELRNRNILVSAAAGSGKTAVLVERIITMLTDEVSPLDVDRLLIVTFTEAAAAEMKERIRSAIEKQLILFPENEHLKQQATLIHGASIMTIHSFCLSVIRDHFHAIQIDPGFRIGEEGELKLLKRDVLGRVLEACYEIGDQSFLAFIDSYAGERDDKRIEDLILKLYEYSRSYPDQEEWLSGCVELYGATTQEALEESTYMQRIRNQVLQYVEDALSLLDEAVEICQEEDGPVVYEEALEADRDILLHLQRAEKYCDYYQIVKELSFVRLKANRDQMVSCEKVEMVKAIRDDVKTVIKDIASQYFYQDIEEALVDIKLCRNAMDVLAALVRDFSKAYEDAKRLRNMIDFGDMEQYALRILTEKREGVLISSATAREYQEQFQEIMIDEYQDSNFLQETILTSVSTVSKGRHNVFMVGDVKQSIYRFRLSRPELFMDKFHTYDTADGVCQRIDLHKNFRSREQVLSSINFLFEQIMTPKLGGITYDEDAALYPGANFTKDEHEVQNDKEAYHTEILLIETKEEDASDRELEAAAITLQIRRLLAQQQVKDKQTGEYRKACYSDIVILTRSMKGFTDVFAEVLNREGIPTYAGTKEGYFAAQEIGVLLSCLRVLDNQKQDIPLATILVSGMCGLSEDEMTMVKCAYKEELFHNAVRLYATEGPDETIQSKLKLCLECLGKLRERVSYTPIHELIWQVLEETGFGDYIAAMPSGEQRRANIEMLVEKARVFESTSYKGLFHFVRYMEQLHKYEVDYGEASLEDEYSDTVRIMTIHKSKGLEFPIVIVAGMGKLFNLQDARSNIVLHANLGVGLNAIDLENRTKSPSILKKVIQKEEVLDSLGEELRVLYVALTRAKEKLIMMGTVKDIEKKLTTCNRITNRKEWQLSFTMLSKATSYWDFILPALMRKGQDIPIILRQVTPEELILDGATEATKERVTKKQLEEWNIDCIYDEQMHRQIAMQFSYQYPYEHAKEKKMKFTVSELKKRASLQEEAGVVLYEEELTPLIPEFLKGEVELTGASRGTVYHRLLELIDFTQEYDAKYLQSVLEGFCQRGQMTADMVACISIEDIIDFLSSEIGIRMHKAALASKLCKEQPFVLGVDARELYVDEEDGELILVQGIIDVYFEEDELVVLDYKTDKVQSEEVLIEKYKGQLDYYAKALEQLTEKKVKEKIIYSFTLRKAITLQ